MLWIEHLMNQEAICGLYDSMYGLEQLSVFEVNLNREGPVLQLRADLARFPDRPSKRWHQEANSAQVQIDFIGVEQLQIQGFGVVNQGILGVSGDSAKYQFTFEGPNLKIQGACAALRVANISAYIK